MKYFHPNPDKRAQLDNYMTVANDNDKAAPESPGQAKAKQEPFTGGERTGGMEGEARPDDDSA